MILNTVIPSLFPFFFLSIMLSGTQISSGGCVLRLAGKLFRMPKGSEYLLIPAFLGGYPAGAQAVTEAWERGSITRESAQKMLGFCSNAGPSFLFGITAAMFPERWMPWALWLLHIFGAWTASCILPCPNTELHTISHRPNKTLPEVLTCALTVLGNVCGWLLLFRVLTAFLDRWLLWILPVTARIVVSGLLELTNGCCHLDQITDVRLRFVAASGLLSLGGLCILLQTHSVTKALTRKYYYAGKMIQACVCICLSAAFMYRIWFPVWILCGILSLCFLNRKKEVAFSSPVVYNSSITSEEANFHAVS